MSETPEHRIKRLKMRSWRRGTKEMDMILGPYSDTEIVNLQAEDLDLYEALLAENDQDLYVWMSRQADAPDDLAHMVNVIRNFHKLA